MKALIQISVSLFLCTAGLPVVAQETAIDCANAQNQNEMNTCAQDDFDRADKELNRVYKQAMAAAVKLDEESLESDPDNIIAAKSLKKAQRAWIDYRDGHCDGYGQLAGGGSMQPLLIFGCKTKVTEARVKELKELIEGLGK